MKFLMNADDFQVTERDALRLILPTRDTAVSNGAWAPDNLWLRSRIEDLVGQTVSQGFGKFFNLGMGPEWCVTRVEHIAAAAERSDAWASIKLDGSLFVRSVHHGRIILRTRGSFGYDHLDNGWEVDQIFHQKYPKLWDLSLFPDRSLLFEWTTPNNQIVMAYGEPQITLIGAVDHARMRYERFSWLEGTSDAIGVPLVQHWALDSAGLASMMNSVATEQRIEGWVVRLRGEQHLVRIKCDPYLAKHRLRSNLSTEGLTDLWYIQGCPTYVEFTRWFAEQYDEETAMWALPVISKLFDGVRVLNSIVNVIKTKVDDALRNDMSRKDFAISMLSQYGQTKKFALCMNLFTGRTDNAEVLKGILLQNTRQMELGMFKRSPEETE
jgi:hypothetical protein